jgi:hypothetical protein
LEILESDSFLKRTGKRTFFNISCNHGKRIASYSYISIENEVILLPATQFIVKSILRPSPGLHIIFLQEVEPDFPWLELPSVIPSVSQPASTYCNLKIKTRIA